MDDIIVRRTCHVCGRDDDEELRGIVGGKTRGAMGRRAGMLTDMIPRLHSPRDKMRHGTLRSACRSYQLFLSSSFGRTASCWEMLRHVSGDTSRGILHSFPNASIQTTITKTPYK